MCTKMQWNIVLHVTQADHKRTYLNHTPSTTGNTTEKINQMGRIISRPQRSADETKCKGHVEVGCEIENSSLTYERSVQVSETNGEEFLLESSGIYFQVVGSSAQLESSSW